MFFKVIISAAEVPLSPSRHQRNVRRCQAFRSVACVAGGISLAGALAAEPLSQTPPHSSRGVRLSSLTREIFRQLRRLFDQ